MTRLPAQTMLATGILITGLLAMCRGNKREQQAPESLGKPVAITMDYPAQGSIFPLSSLHRPGCGEIHATRRLPGRSALPLRMALPPSIRLPPASG